MNGSQGGACARLRLAPAGDRPARPTGNDTRNHTQPTHRNTLTTLSQMQVREG